MTANQGVSNALVIGHSGGIGAALSATLLEDGASVRGLSRSGDGFDISDPNSVERHLAGIEEKFELIVIATGILAPQGKTPEKSLTAIEADSMAEMFAVNAIGPALVLRHVSRLLNLNQRSVVAVITARVGSIADNRAGGWYSYRASKAAANQIVRSAAIEITRKRKQACVVALHPGTVDTAFTSSYPNHDKHSPAQAAAHLLAVIDRLTPEMTGQFFDWAGEPIPW